MTTHLTGAAVAASNGHLDQIDYSAGASALAGQTLARLGARSPIAILSDGVATPVDDGDLLAKVVASIEASGLVTEIVTPLIDDHGLVLDERTVQDSADRLAAAGGVVSVGSGTITDLGKAATAEGVPLVAVQSAASVNGYADAMSVLINAGAKSTRPTRWPNAILIESDALERSPDTLVGSGVGDAVAIGSSIADWVLASHLTGAEADPAVLTDLMDAVGRLHDGREADGAMPALVDALTYGGLSIGVVGSTAPLSGCEHLTSHILDMAAIAEGTEHDLHGRQVGVATVLSTALWEIALERDLVRIDSGTTYPEDTLDRVDTTWRVVDPSGRLSETCQANVAQKIAVWQETAATRPTIDADLVDRLRGLLAAPQYVARTLSQWGAPLTFSALTPAISEERAKWVLSALPFMRNRVTLADLLVMNGAWDDELIDAVFARAAAAGGGA
jgi:glycerol-1-phosphate dehydrogenase [NAD(P)+]